MRKTPGIKSKNNFYFRKNLFAGKMKCWNQVIKLCVCRSCSRVYLKNTCKTFRFFHKNTLVVTIFTRQNIVWKLAQLLFILLQDFSASARSHRVHKTICHQRVQLFLLLKTKYYSLKENHRFIHNQFRFITL